jgi:hypothetical protein
MKTASKIKFYEVLNWLFSTEEMPQRFKDAKTQLNSIVPYLEEQFWTKPQVVRYLNEHTNDLFNIPAPIAKLELIRKIIKFQGLTKNDLYDYRSQFQPDILKEIEERDDYDEGNARSRLMMIRKKGIDPSSYIKKAPTKKNIDLNNSEVKATVDFALKKQQEKYQVERQQRLAHDERFIRVLNQDVIDELGLVLFDISLLKKTNRVLFSFIDARNQKRYYTEPFMAEFYVSQTAGVINNDYIEDLTEDKFHKYAIRDHRLYTKLKFILNNNYKRIVNGG